MKNKSKSKSLSLPLTLLSIVIAGSSSFNVKLGTAASETHFNYAIQWDETKTCPHTLDTAFPYIDYISGVKSSQDIYPWASPYVKKFEDTQDTQHLMELSSKAVSRKWVDIFIWVVITLTFIMTFLYFLVRCIAGNMKKDKITQEKIKEGCCIRMAKGPKFKKFINFFTVVMVIVSLAFNFRTRHHTSNTLESWKMVDCAYHRILESMIKGIPEFDWDATLNQTQPVPKTSALNGFFGIGGYEYFLNMVAKDF